jgi:hypothetical protein
LTDDVCGIAPEILAGRKVLSQEQRAFYFDSGYLLLPEFVPGVWLQHLRAVTAAMIEESRTVTRSDEKFVLETGHSAATPRLRRLTSPVEHDAAYWEFAATRARWSRLFKLIQQSLIVRRFASFGKSLTTRQKSVNIIH